MAPPSSAYSVAVLSSTLVSVSSRFPGGGGGGEGLSVCVRGFGSDEHLFAAVDQPLLYWRDALLLLDLLLNLGDLDLGRVISKWDPDACV